MTRDEFLAFVRTYVASDPEAAPHIAAHAAAGLKEALDKAYERAADMEVALVAVMMPRIGKGWELVGDKLEKWKGRTSLKWDWFFEKLKELRP